MGLTLKSLKEQVIVITGASSGIGLATAKTAAGRGAKVVLVARDEAALSSAVEDIRARGGEAVSSVGDVADSDQLKAAAQIAIDAYGRIDTWVNNAGVSIYGRISEISDEDNKRLFETNFWGVVNGSRVAVDHLKNTGGALINIGSVLSDVSVPIQGMYSASKHAVAGFTDALRVELEEASVPISVTLIKPSAINTPYVKHAKNYMDKEPNLPAPVYAPELVVEQVLYAATTPVRDLFVGGGGRAMSGMATLMPGVMDWIMAKVMVPQQQTSSESRHQPGTLFESGGSHEVSGDAAERNRTVRQFSVTDTVSRHPYLLLGAIGALAAVGAYAAASVPRRPETLTEKARSAAGRLPGQARGWAKEIPNRARDWAEQVPSTSSLLASAKSIYDKYTR